MGSPAERERGGGQSGAGGRGRMCGLCQGHAEALDHEWHRGHPGGRASSSSHLQLARCRREHLAISPTSPAGGEPGGGYTSSSSEARKSGHSGAYPSCGVHLDLNCVSPDVPAPGITRISAFPAKPKHPVEAGMDGGNGPSCPRAWTRGRPEAHHTRGLTMTEDTLATGTKAISRDTGGSK